MPSWWIKAGLQKVISLLPGRHRLNELLQTYVTDSVSLTEQRFAFKMDECRRHLDNLFDQRPDVRPGFTVFELGPGWYPTVAVGAFLCGAGEVWTCDCAPLLRYERVRQLLERLSRAWDDGQLQTLLPRTLPERFEQLRRALANPRLKTAEALLEALHIHVHVADARHTRLPSESIDFIVSIGVLLHIPRPILAEILDEFYRIGKPNVAQSHFIDMMDLFAYFDKSISPLNFLRYSDRAWRWIDNSIVPMNRLRISDYRTLFVKAGFEVTREIPTVIATEEDLARVPLAAEFRRYSADDLRLLMLYIASRKNPALIEGAARGATTSERVF